MYVQKEFENKNPRDHAHEKVWNEIKWKKEKVATA